MDSIRGTGRGINRRVELSSPSTQKPIALSRLKYIDTDQLRVLMPLDANGEAIEYLPNEPVILRELSRGVAPIAHDTYVQEIDMPNASWGNLIVLAQPQDNPICKRQFARVDAVFPVSVNVPHSQERLEALATNLSAGGVLATITQGDAKSLALGIEVSVELHLPDDEMFGFPGVIRRSFTFERESGSSNSVAIQFQIADPAQQESLVRYVLTREIELRTLDIVNHEAPLQQQIELLREEVVQLREELKLAHERETQAAEARRRSDATIMQLTRLVDDRDRRIADLMRERRAPWWRFWRRG